jgi:dipeptidyl aminopeptidase/acylaminoacyl peptidase
MTSKAVFLSLLALLVCACSPAVVIEPAGERKIGDQEVQVEEIQFRSGKFKVVGDLLIPKDGERHPAIIMVHGDGPALRSGAVPFGPTMEIFLRHGFAVFSWDKPGSGESTGEINNALTQRADILVDGIEVLIEHPAIDPDQIGIWGISQAGWVMPLALEQSDEIDFMVVVSGGAEDSIEQGAYYVGQQVIELGGTEEQAALVDKYYSQYRKASSYEEYREAIEVLVSIPQLQNQYQFEIAEERQWKPLSRKFDAFIDPMDIIVRTTIPVLAFFGELDKNIDPVQGAEAYEVALQKAGNEHYQIITIPDVEHVFVTSPRYLEPLEAWLQQLEP